MEIDPEARTARVQAGTLWLEVTEASTPHGLYPLSGSSPDVGVVGYTLGGGLSWLARKHGLAADSVIAIELVTPAGELVRATAEDHAELFWALRGGAGNFGVVTAMEFRLYPYADVYAGFMLFPYERHAEVLRTWRDWTRTAPEEVTTSFRIMHLPPLPELPPFLAGRSIVVIDGAYAGDAEAGAAALAPLRALGPGDGHVRARPRRPRSAGSTWTPRSRCPSGAAGRSSTRPTTRCSRPSPRACSRARRSCSASCATSAARWPASPSTRARSARSRASTSSTRAARSWRPEMAPAVVAALEGFLTGLANWKHDRMYLNFAEDATDPVALFGEERAARLRAIRATVDPDG